MKNRMIFAFAMAVLFGMIFWQQSPTLGISVGLCMGAAYGLFEGEGEETEENKEINDLR